MQIGAAIRRWPLCAVVVFGAMACNARSGTHECEVAVLRYWDSLDIEPYFSALPLVDAVTRCKELDARTRRCAGEAPSEQLSACPGIEQLPVDRGWRAGLHCYVSHDAGWSRCERSNRECEYYRRVAERGQREVSRCAPAERAWAIVHRGDPVDPQPSLSECERVRGQLRASGRITEASLCREMGYAELVRGRRRFIPSPTTR